MTDGCQRLVDDYLNWLRERVSVENVDGACRITTPFLDRHNDRLQIYVHSTDHGVRISDDGYILGDLESSGCPVDTPNRRSMLQSILNGFGVHEFDGELYVDATTTNFSHKKHRLIQAMLSVGDMFMTAKHRITTTFLEDVSGYLDESDVRYTKKVEFTGKSGFTHLYDFVIPKSRKRPERLIRAVNDADRSHTSQILFAWTDTQEVREQGSVIYVIVNDHDKVVNPDSVAALGEYGAIVIPWSQRNSFVVELAA